MITKGRLQPRDPKVSNWRKVVRYIPSTDEIAPRRCAPPPSALPMWPSRWPAKVRMRLARSKISQDSKPDCSLYVHDMLLTYSGIPGFRPVVRRPALMRRDLAIERRRSFREGPDPRCEGTYRVRVGPYAHPCRSCQAAVRRGPSKDKPGGPHGGSSSRGPKKRCSE